MTLARETREITSTGEWLSWRERDITASRVAALFDAHPYMTRDQLAATIRGAAVEEKNEVDLRRGRVFENAIGAAIAEDRPEWALRKANTYHRLPDHRLGCTPDYFAEIGERRLVVQTKAVNPFEWNRWAGHPPLGYLLQVACESLVIGADDGVLAVMVTSGNFPVFYFDVPRHEAAEKRILDAVAEWWRAFDAGEIASPAPIEAIAAELDDGSHKDLSADNMMPGLLAERAELKATVSAAEKRLGGIDYEIKNRIGPARTAYVPGWALSFKSQHRKETIIPAAEIRVLRVRAIAEDLSNE